MTDTQTLEILEVIKTLPSEKIDEVKDFAIFLRDRYRKSENIVENDEWRDEDLQDISNSPNKKTPAEFLAEIAALPIEGKTDEFSGRDHDKVLYGEDRAR